METHPGLVTWAAGRRRWSAGHQGDGSEMAGGGGRAVRRDSPRKDDVGRVGTNQTVAGGPSYL